MVSFVHFCVCSQYIVLRKIPLLCELSFRNESQFWVDTILQSLGHALKKTKKQKKTCCSDDLEEQFTTTIP